MKRRAAWPAAHETVPTWIVADRQTAGRGRRGRAWQSPVGNLMTTLYLPISFDAVKAGSWLCRRFGVGAHGQRAYRVARHSQFEMA